MSFAGKPAMGTPEERDEWRQKLVPRAPDFEQSRASQVDLEEAQVCGWGQGDLEEARADVLLPHSCGERSREVLDHPQHPVLVLAHVRVHMVLAGEGQDHLQRH